MDNSGIHSIIKQLIKDFLPEITSTNKVKEEYEQILDNNLLINKIKEILINIDNYLIYKGKFKNQGLKYLIGLFEGNNQLKYYIYSFLNKDIKEDLYEDDFTKIIDDLKLLDENNIKDFKKMKKYLDDNYDIVDYYTYSDKLTRFIRLIASDSLLIGNFLKDYFSVNRNDDLNKKEKEIFGKILFPNIDLLGYIKELLSGFGIQNYKDLLYFCCINGSYKKITSLFKILPSKTKSLK